MSSSQSQPQAKQTLDFVQTCIQMPLFHGDIHEQTDQLIGQHCAEDNLAFFNGFPPIALNQQGIHIHEEVLVLNQIPVLVLTGTAFLADRYLLKGLLKERVLSLSTKNQTQWQQLNQSLHM